MGAVNPANPSEIHRSTRRKCRNQGRVAEVGLRSLLGQAIDYALNRWETLIRYVDDGRLEIDNNLCENAIRPTAVGKKNFLFIGHPEAGQRSAVIYSVLGS